MILCFILPITFIFGNGESSDINFEKVINIAKKSREYNQDIGHEMMGYLNNIIIYGMKFKIFDTGIVTLHHVKLLTILIFLNSSLYSSRLDHLYLRTINISILYWLIG